MKEFQVAYFPIGVPTFHLESANKEMQGSSELLKSICENTAVPEELLLSLDTLDAFMEGLDPDLLVIQNATFANAAYTKEILCRFPEVPLILWALKEPVIDGGRLRLNSLTGAYSAANTIKQYRKEPLEFILGSPSEEKVRKYLEAAVKAAELKKDLQLLKLAAIGDPPQGFGFGKADDADLMNAFGVKLQSAEARELMERASNYTDSDCEEYLKDAERRTSGLNSIPEKNRKDFARLYKAYSEYVRENNISALASRCWPDFFTEYGTPVCTVLGILNDIGIPSACEADSYGALSMYMGMYLTGMPAFFGDPVSMDEAENTITLWHCGMAACSLAREDTGACIGEHCNRHIGPTLEFGCRAYPEVTVFRVGRSPEGEFRFFIATGEAIDKPKQFFGTSLSVRTNASAEAIVNTTVKEGWEPHYAVIYGNCADSLEILGHMLGLEVERF